MLSFKDGIVCGTSVNCWLLISGMHLIVIDIVLETHLIVPLPQAIIFPRHLSAAIPLVSVISCDNIFFFCYWMASWPIALLHL